MLRTSQQHDRLLPWGGLSRAIKKRKPAALAGHLVWGSHSPRKICIPVHKLPSLLQFHQIRRVQMLVGCPKSWTQLNTRPFLRILRHFLYGIRKIWMEDPHKTVLFNLYKFLLLIARFFICILQSAKVMTFVRFIVYVPNIRSVMVKLV